MKMILNSNLLTLSKVSISYLFSFFLKKFELISNYWFEFRLYIKNWFDYITLTTVDYMTTSSNFEVILNLDDVQGMVRISECSQHPLFQKIFLPVYQFYFLHIVVDLFYILLLEENVYIAYRLRVRRVVNVVNCRSHVVKEVVDYNNP